MEMGLHAVGKVNGCGYDGQQKDTFCDARGPCRMNQSALKPVFCQFPHRDSTDRPLRHVTFDIGQFLWTTKDDTTDCFTLVHTRRVIRTN